MCSVSSGASGGRQTVERTPQSRSRCAARHIFPAQAASGGRSAETKGCRRGLARLRLFRLLPRRSGRFTRGKYVPSVFTYRGLCNPNCASGSAKRCSTVGRVEARTFGRAMRRCATIRDARQAHHPRAEGSADREDHAIGYSPDGLSQGNCPDRQLFKSTRKVTKRARSAIR